MAEFTDREHYIPLRKSDLVALMCKDTKLNEEERNQYKRFCTLVGAIWHFEYYEMLDKLKDDYAAFDPDRVTKDLDPLPTDKRPGKMDVLFEDFTKLMEKANFKRMTRKDIDEAVEGGASDWGLNMSVDWDVFERMEIYARGDAKVTRVKRHPILFWRKTEKEVDTYQRLVLMIKLRPHKRLPENIDTDAVFLKVFKDIPKLDLEMVLPGTQLQMPLSTKFKFGGSLLGTLASIAVKLIDDVIYAAKAVATATVEMATTAASTAATAAWAPLALFGGFAYKQYYSYTVTKQTYSKMLTESLYFQNLDNNAGVITQVLDEAEEQECRETMLAYFYLWKYAPADGWTSQQLDDYVEMELEGKHGLKVDFEVEDAIGKLERLGIVTKSGDKYTAVGIEQALEKLDYKWDNYFQYNQSGASSPGTPSAPAAPAKPQSGGKYGFQF